MNEILQKTYDILDAKGWCQGQHQNQDGQVCLEGAFLYAANGVDGVEDVYDLDAWDLSYVAPPKFREAWLLLCETVRKETGFHAPCDWNDLPSTTAEDVKLVLKKAISAEGD